MNGHSGFTAWTQPGRHRRIQSTFGRRTHLRGDSSNSHCSSAAHSLQWIGAFTARYVERSTYATVCSIKKVRPANWIDIFFYVLQGRSWPSNWNWGRFRAATTTTTIRKLVRAFLTSFPPPLTVLVAAYYRCYTFIGGERDLESTTTYRKYKNEISGLSELSWSAGTFSIY